MKKLIKINKRGVTNIIVAGFLILVSVASISILWAIVSKLTDEAQLSPAFSCAEWQIEAPMNIDGACYRSSTNDLEITVSRNKDILDIYTLGLVVQLDDRKIQAECGESCGFCTILPPKSTKTYYIAIDSEELAQSALLSVNGCEFGQKSIAVCS